MEAVDAGQCRFCEQGHCRLVVCADCEMIVALCDECDAMWLAPGPEVVPVFPEQPDLPCPFCGAGGGWEHWKPASPAQLIGTRWSKEGEPDEC